MSFATEPVRLACEFCGHWEKGQRTKEQIAEWMRVHRNASLGVYSGELELASTCPHSCTEKAVTHKLVRHNKGPDLWGECSCGQWAWLGTYEMPRGRLPKLRAEHAEHVKWATHQEREQ